MPSKTTKQAATRVVEHTIRHEQVRAGNLTVDHRVQRDHLNQSKLNKIREKYNRAALSTLVVSERPDGTMVIIDGQHRWTIVLELEGKDILLNAEIHTGLSLAEEAALFVDLNVQEAANPLDLHKARVTQGEEVAVAISKAAHDHGWRIGVGKGCISAVKVLENLYLLGEDWFDGYGKDLVSKTLYLVTEAWGHDVRKAVNQYILKAVGSFILACERWASEEQKPDDYMDWDGLAYQMVGTFKGGPDSWLTASRSIADGSTKTLHEAMLEELFKVYNKGRQQRKLPTRFRTRFLDA